MGNAQQVGICNRLLCRENFAATQLFSNGGTGWPADAGTPTWCHGFCISRKLCNE